MFHRGFSRVERDKEIETSKGDMQSREKHVFIECAKFLKVCECQVAQEISEER